MKPRQILLYALLTPLLLMGLGGCANDRAKVFPEIDNAVSFSWKDVKTAVISDGWSPRVYTLSDGRMLAAVEKSDGIHIMSSADGGNTWNGDIIASFCDELSCANPNLFQLTDESVLLSYRATGARDDGFYTSLQVSISTDGGASFIHHSTVAEYIEESGEYRGVWEPCIGYLNDVLTCFYANDSTSVTEMQNIEYKQWDGSAWVNRTVVSDGISHNSRDGMPVWIPLKDGGYACVIESSHLRDADGSHPFVIQLLYSSDGVNWSAPTDIYYPTTEFSKAGAPGIAELPNGQIVVSFQTDESSTEKGDGTSVMKTIISNGSSVSELTADSFTAGDTVFEVPDGSAAVWTGIWFDGQTLYASAGTPDGASLKQIDFSNMEPWNTFQNN